jgi:5-methyltetrahydropteroyltriglutamate--homocysteine methyltransferase
MTQIRTTHTGSLPRPAHLIETLLARERGEPTPGIKDEVDAAVDAIVRRQVETGIDLIDDGEMGKIGFAMYIKDRLSGFGGEHKWVGRRRPEMEDHPDFAERFAATLNQAVLSNPACDDDIHMKSLDDVRADVARLKSAARAAGVAVDRLFMTAPSPGVISHFFGNLHYPSRRAYLEALADAMKSEYEVVAESGITLQVDCPDLAMSRHSVFADLSREEFRREAALNVEVLNHALERIPAEKVRMHVCWGNYEGPHNHDIELKDIIDIVYSAKPAGISLEASNPRHGHEWQVFEDHKLPDGKYLIPGVVDSTNNYVEHPQLVAQRLLNYARVVGPERVVGGSDCGFGTVATMAMVAPSIVWSKLSSLAEGARIASSAYAMS